MKTLLPPPSHSTLKPASASSNVNSLKRFARTPLATAALLAIFAFPTAHALPTSYDGASSSHDLSSSIEEQFPESIKIYPNVSPYPRVIK